MRAADHSATTHGDDEMIRVRRDELLRAWEERSIGDVEIDETADRGGVPFRGASNFHDASVSDRVARRGIYLNRRRRVCSAHGLPSHSRTPVAPVPVIRPLSTDAEARACAELMSSTDPWLRLGRTLDESYAIVRDPAREIYVASSSPGGLRAVASRASRSSSCRARSSATSRQWRCDGTVAAAGWERRSSQFAERRILRDQPNVFICASSFNPAARRLYERLGYHVVGELTDFIVRGHSEILLRKTTGPLSEH